MAGGNNLSQIGKVVLVKNQVQAESSDGTVRTLSAHDPIYFNDRIITGPNGAVSIGFGDPVQTTLDLGRGSDFVIDNDVYQGGPGDGPDLADVTAEIEQIQQAILEGAGIQMEDLPAPAAGPAAGPANAGGGTFYTEFTLTGGEVTPTATNSETTGVQLDFLNPEFVELAAASAAVPVTALFQAGGGGEEIVPYARPEENPEDEFDFTVDVGLRVVEEEALDNYTGYSPIVGSTGNPDENDGPEDGTTPDAVEVSGSLVSGSSAGMEFSITSLDNLPQLFSQGEAITYKLAGNGTTIEAWVEGSTVYQDQMYYDGEGGGRLIFTCDVQPDGTYTFTLFDQLDHVAPEGGFDADENFALISAGGSITAIDFSGSITVTNAGGASSGLEPGSLSFSVVDDIPVAVAPEAIPESLNLVLVLDNSGSMYRNFIDWDGDSSTTRTMALRDSVKSLLETLKNSSAANIQICMVSFNTGSELLGTFTLKSGGLVDEDELAKALMALDGMESPYGNEFFGDEYTNYEAGLQEAFLWTDGDDPLTGAGVVNELLFFTDGDPSRYNDPNLFVIDEDGNVTEQVPDARIGDADKSLAEVLGSDETNEIALLEANDYTVRTIGIGLDSDQVSRLDQLDSLGESTNLNSGSQLVALLPSLVTVHKPIIDVHVEEDDLNPFDLVDDDTALGYNEDASINGDEADSDSSQNLSDLFRSGADEDLTFSLGTITSKLPVLWSGGEKLVYTVDGNVLTATAHGDTIFTFIVEEDGSWSFDLDGQLDHIAGGDENVELVAGENGDLVVYGIDLSSMIFARDFDQDAVPAADGAFVVEVEDDVPFIGDPYDAIMANEEGTHLVADLNMEFGSDGQGSIVITPDEDNIGKNDKVLDNDGDVMKLDGEKLYWVDNGDGSWSAETDGGIVAFIVAPEMDGDLYTGNYTVDVINAMDDKIESFSIDFTREPSDYTPGNNSGDVPGHDLETSFDFVDGDVRVTATAVDPDTEPDNVNWSVKGLGVGIDTFVGYDTDDSEQLILTFTDVNDSTSVTVTSATFGIENLDVEHGADNLSDQTETEVGRWTAYKDGEEVGSDVFEGIYSGGSDILFIDVEVDGGFDTIVFSSESNSEGIFNADYRVTSVDAEYLEDLHTFDFDVTVTDYDGDQVTSSFDLTLDSDNELIGSSDAEVIVGSTGDDTILAGDGDDIVFGGEGDDIIFGEEGNDILDGGEEAVPELEGNDLITGGTGEDTFDSAEEAAGEVLDYSGDPAPAGVDQDDLMDNLVPAAEV